MIRRIRIWLAKNLLPDKCGWRIIPVIEEHEIGESYLITGPARPAEPIRKGGENPPWAGPIPDPPPAPPKAMKE